MGYITLEWATDRGACYSAVRAFKKKFGEKASVKEVLEWLTKIDAPGWLAWIMGQNDLGITKELLRLGANINVNSGFALDLASSKGRLKVVKFLVKNGADFQFFSDAIQYASNQGHRDVAKFLRQAEKQKLAEE